MNEPQSVWEYFVQSVDIKAPDKCWEWKKSCASSGYGNWYWDKKAGGAHRESFKLFEKFDLELSVLHKCGNRKCCNPEHLYAGTQKQNVKDTRDHGRYSPPPYKRGEAVGTSKLTEDIVRKIKIDLKNNKSLKELADKYNVTVQCICLIKKEKNWKWVVVD
jgi:hypothetical protein